MKDRILKSSCAALLIAMLLLLTVISVTAINTEKAEKKSDKVRAASAQAVQSLTVRITTKGFEPKSFSLKPNVPARLTFTRQTARTCGTAIVIQAYGINRPLPLNKPVTVEFMPDKAGAFDFACGMGMLRGKIIVE
jgi:plastocyanin domain-containing protein